MANVKKGTMTAAREWWKHLRWTKRIFWKAERKAYKKEIDKEAHTTQSTLNDVQFTHCDSAATTFRKYHGIRY